MNRTLTNQPGKQALLLFILTTVFGITSFKSSAGEPDYIQDTKPKCILFNLGIGYGISNNPTHINNEPMYLQGAVIAGSLGYKISEKFKIGFGPSIWIESKDILNKFSSGPAKPANKRMIVSFDGYYSPFKNFPLSIKLGAGIGTVVYTKENRRISIDSKTTNNTEFMSGFAGTASLIYQIRISQSLKIYPSLNFSYTDINNPDATYEGYLDAGKPSITYDFKANFLFYF